MQQIEAGKRLVREFAKYMPVQAAFWLNDTERNHWFLYLASDQIDNSNFDLAYGEVGRITSKMPDIWLDPFQIKVAGLSDPIPKAVVEIQSKYPQHTDIRYRGGRSVGEVYIYALPIPAAA